MISRYLISPLLNSRDVLQAMHDISTSGQGGNLKLVLQTSRDEIMEILKATNQFTERNIGAITVLDELIEMFSQSRERLESIKNNH